MKKRLLTLAAAGVLFLSFAGGASAQPYNFGQCAAGEARYFPPGPDHGQDLRLASIFNPSGVGLTCPGPNPGQQ